MGKLPPQALEIEEAVIASMLIDTGALDIAIQKIYSEDVFYSEANKSIYTAIRNITTKGSQVDLLTVCEELKRLGKLDLAGGYLRIAQISNSIFSAVNIEEHLKILFERYLSRKVIEVSNEAIKEAYIEGNDVFEVLDRVSSAIQSINEMVHRLKEVSFADLVADVSFKIKEAAKNDYLQGIPTGSNKFDKATGGWQRGDLIIGAARPSMGKTTFTIAKALQQAKRNIGVGYISLEVTGAALVKKSLSNLCQIDGMIINKGGLQYNEWQVFDKKVGELMGYPIYVYDTGDSSIDRIIAWIKSIHAKYRVEMFYLDYIQLCKATNKHSGQDANRDMSEVSRKLKQVALQLNIVIFALSQLSRECEKRSDKRPMLSDLRDSGAIEANADVVLLFYRDEYYGIERDKDGNSTEGVAEIDIAKFRNGQTGVIKQQFHNKFSDFTDIEFNTPSYSSDTKFDTPF